MPCFMAYHGLHPRCISPSSFVSVLKPMHCARISARPCGPVGPGRSSPLSPSFQTSVTWLPDALLRGWSLFNIALLINGEKIWNCDFANFNNDE